MEEALQVGVGVREAVGEVVDLVLLRVLGRVRVRVGVRGRVRVSYGQGQDQAGLGSG